VSTSVDLLSMVELPGDSFQGSWEMKKGALVCTQIGAAAGVAIPYAPPEEYDLTVVAECRGALEMLLIGLTQGARTFAAGLDGWGGTRSCLGSLDGKWGEIPEMLYSGGVFKKGKASVIVCAVRKTGVKVTVDGKTILSWRGDLNRLSGPPGYTPPAKTGIYVGCNAPYSVLRISLEPITGRGAGTR